MGVPVTVGSIYRVAFRRVGRVRHPVKLEACAYLPILCSATLCFGGKCGGRKLGRKARLSVQFCVGTRNAPEEGNGDTKGRESKKANRSKESQVCEVSRWK